MFSLPHEVWQSVLGDCVRTHLCRDGAASKTEVETTARATLVLMTERGDAGKLPNLMLSCIDPAKTF